MQCEAKASVQPISWLMNAISAKMENKSIVGKKSEGAVSGGNKWHQHEFVQQAEGGVFNSSGSGFWMASIFFFFLTTCPPAPAFLVQAGDYLLWSANNLVSCLACRNIRNVGLGTRVSE